MTTIDTESKLLQLTATLKLLAYTVATRDEEVDNNDIGHVANLAHELAEQVYTEYTEIVYQVRGALTAHAEAVAPALA